MGCASVPLHQVNLQSDLVSGFVEFSVCAQLPVKGVQVILGIRSCSPVVEKQPSVAIAVSGSIFCLCCDVGRNSNFKK